MTFRLQPRRWPAMPMRRRPLLRRSWRKARPSSSRFPRPTSCTSRRSAASGSNLTSEAAVRTAVTDILARARAARPDARIDGVTIHPMILRPKARELIAGLADDPTFGPVVVFGSGGTAVEVIADKALALPPLDLELARDLIGRTRVSRLLKAYRNVPAADTRRARAGAGQARAARRRPAGGARARSQPAARRRDRRDRGRCPRRGRAGGSGAPRPARPSALCDPALSEGMGAARRAARRHQGAGAAGAAGGRAALRAVLRQASRSTICGCASLRRSRNSATPSWRASPRSTMRAPWRSSRSTRRPAKCSAWCACTPMPTTTAANTPCWCAPT